MPIRFRKSITIFPGVRLNFSKTGTSLTVGKRGAFTLNFSKRGVRETTDLPGEGLYHTSYLFKNKKGEKESSEEDVAEEKDDKPKRRTRRTLRESGSSVGSFFLFIFVALFFFYFGADALGLIPQNFVTNLLRAITSWAGQLGL